jgi:hypothetical protein
VSRYGPAPDRRLETLPGREFFDKLLDASAAAAIEEKA